MVGRGRGRGPRGGVGTDGGDDVEPTMGLIEKEAPSWSPVFLDILRKGDVRVAGEALRAVTNLATRSEMRRMFVDQGYIEVIVPLLGKASLLHASAWALSNLSMDDRSVMAIRNAGAIELMVPALPSASPVAQEKILWALYNLLGDDRARDIIATERGSLSTLVALLECEGEPSLLIPTIDVLSVLCLNQRVAAQLGEMGVPQHFCSLLVRTHLPEGAREKLCWAIIRLVVGHRMFIPFLSLSP